MKKTRCPICWTDQRVIGFKKDDPVLECGHTLTVDLQERRDWDIFPEELLAGLQEWANTIMSEQGVTFEEAERQIVNQFRFLG